MSLRRFALLFKDLSAGLEASTDPDLRAEWSDAMGLMAVGWERAGPDGGVYVTACTLESFIHAVEAGTIEGVPRKVVKVNRRILRTVRDRMTADEREDVDRMITDRHAEIEGWIREETQTDGPPAGRE